MSSGVAKELTSQVWYWPDACRQTVDRALNDCPDGYFIVRNSSGSNWLTLSVKVQNQIKLLRIFIFDGKCGFDFESTFESILDLVHHYRQNSLNSFNSSLDVCLLYPAINFQMQRAILEIPNLPDWEANMELEKFRGVRMSFERATKVYILAQEKMAMAENRCSALDGSILRDQDKLAKLRELLNLDLVAMEAIKKNIPNPEEQLMDAFSHSKEFLENTICIVSADVEKAIEEKQKFEEVFLVVAREQARAKTRICKLAVSLKTVSSGLDSSLAEKMAAGVELCQEMVLIEPDKVTYLLVDMELKWEPREWLMAETSLKNATNTLFQARQRKINHEKNFSIENSSHDGIFLIRASLEPETLVLSVLYGNNVFHCPIVQNQNGWGFGGTNIRMPTVADLVRYYSSHSLVQHVKEIETSLKTPVFFLEDTVNAAKPVALSNNLGTTINGTDEEVQSETPSSEMPSTSSVEQHDSLSLE